MTGMATQGGAHADQSDVERIWAALGVPPAAYFTFLRAPRRSELVATEAVPPAAVPAPAIPEPLPAPVSVETAEPRDEPDTAANQGAPGAPEAAAPQPAEPDLVEPGPVLDPAAAPVEPDSVGPQRSLPAFGVLTTLSEHSPPPANPTTTRPPPAARMVEPPDEGAPRDIEAAPDMFRRLSPVRDAPAPMPAAPNPPIPKGRLRLGGVPDVPPLPGSPPALLGLHDLYERF